MQQTADEFFPGFMGGSWCCKAVRRVEHADLSSQALLHHSGQAPVLSWCHWQGGDRAWLGSPCSDFYLFGFLMHLHLKKSCLLSKKLPELIIAGARNPDFPPSPNKHNPNTTLFMPAEHPSPPASMENAIRRAFGYF